MEKLSMYITLLEGKIYYIASNVLLKPSYFWRFKRGQHNGFVFVEPEGAQKSHCRT